MKRSESLRLIRVGVAVAVSVTVLIVVLALLGKSRALFSNKATLHTSFKNISGLVVGAPVRLAGVDIGIVHSIHFDPDLRVKDVHVDLSVQAQYLNRIREDSIADLTSKGLLGDMIINISVGSANVPALHDGSIVPSKETLGLSEIAGSVTKAVEQVQTLASDVDDRLRAVLGPEVAQDLGRSLRSSANLIERIEKGDGLLHALVYKPQMAQDASALLSQARTSAARLSVALSRVDHLLAALETGHGTLHELFYGTQGKKVIDDLEVSMREIGQVVEEVRTGHGLLHELIYEEDSGKLLKDLSATARILHTIAEETQQGKGTVGGLLRDPTIYEDLKTLLGNVSRSRLLKAVIRYEIRKDGLTRE